ncbi:MAG: hypothetical protein M1834_001268 [Cirrosporium novae-zelandiae]|nr:MAG: hypothetical protein M1834_001268 [Cirrosporium novae-zelandiae]
MSSLPQPVTLDTPITVKVIIDNTNRRFKLPLRACSATAFDEKLRFLLAIPPNETITIDRYSDSAASYITLDRNLPSVYKQLFRAAKAKLKLRIRVTRQINSSPDVSTTNSLPTLPQPLLHPEPLVPVPALEPLIKDVPVEEEHKDEAPVPSPFAASTDTFVDPSYYPKTLAHDLIFPTDRSISSMASFRIDCNHCNKPVSNKHFHCSICDNGDFDLCPACVDAGVSCGGEGHWLIKRSFENGHVITSTTERLPPSKKADETPAPTPEKLTEKSVEHIEPAKVVEEVQEKIPEIPCLTRICNSCIEVRPESEMVTCKDCEDYDLCLGCHLDNKHGHNPRHTFTGIGAHILDDASIALASPGRNTRHPAICDGCDKTIFGLRHKCLECPDYDLCANCKLSAPEIHPRHRFVCVTEVQNLETSHGPMPIHFGITCDGVLCKTKTLKRYIYGVRYKCAVCHDTDFCANCEASPLNRHNRTHPLIKFKTPVRNVSVTTLGDKVNGDETLVMGDQMPKTKSKSTETVPAAPSANAATQVQTVAEVKPTENDPEQYRKSVADLREKIAILSQRLRNRLDEERAKEASSAETRPTSSSKLKSKACSHWLQTGQCEFGQDCIYRHESQDLVKIKVPEDLEITKEEFVIKGDIIAPAPSQDLQAHFIKDIVPDSTKVEPNQRFSQVWTLRNPGPRAWPANCSVRFVGGDNMLDVDRDHPSNSDMLNEATESNVIRHVVQVGETVNFEVCMKAPEREGKAISYWRLKTFAGVPFGHKLWCEVDVCKVPEATVAETEHVEYAPETSEEPAVEEESVPKEPADEPIKESVDEPVTEKVEEVEEKFEESQETATAEKEQSESQMIFPTLEKESPVSSTHELASAHEAHEDHISAVEIDHAVAELSEYDGDDWEEGVTDDGFVTDEEYDILDASDEEYLDAQQAPRK